MCRKNSFLFFCLAVCATSVAVGTVSDRINVEPIQRAIEAGENDEALGLLDRLPPADSSSPLAQHLRGIALYQKGQYARAIEHLLQGRNGGRNTPAQNLQAAQLLGMSHYLLGRANDAIPFLEEYQGSPRATLETAYVLAFCYLQSGARDTARVEFARMFGIDARSAGAYLLNAQMMLRIHHEDAAEAELKQALALDPLLPQLHFMLGELAVYRGDVPGGITLFQKEIELNPGFAMSYYRLGEAYSRLEKWDEAIPPLQKSIWLNQFFSGPFIVLGKVYLKTGNLANAESVLRRGLAMDVNNYTGHFLLGQVLQRAGKIDEAKQALETAERLRTESVARQ